MEQMGFILIVIVCGAVIAIAATLYYMYEYYSKKRTNMKIRDPEDIAERIAAEQGGTFVFHIGTKEHGSMVHKHEKGLNHLGKMVYNIEFLPPTIFPLKESHYMENISEDQIQEVRVDAPGFSGKRVMIVWPSPEELEKICPFTDSEKKNRKIIAKLRERVTELTDELRLQKQKPLIKEEMKKDALLLKEMLGWPEKKEITGIGLEKSENKKSEP